jgi:hypothetical protein
MADNEPYAGGVPVESIPAGPASAAPTIAPTAEAAPPTTVAPATTNVIKSEIDRSPAQQIVDTRRANTTLERNDGTPTNADVDKNLLSGKTEIKFSAQELESIGLILEHRLDEIGNTASGDLDRIVADLGRGAMERFKANSFTKNDVALALTLISELRTLTEMATGLTAEEGKTFWRRLPKIKVTDVRGATKTLFDHSEAMGERTIKETQEKYLSELSGLESTIGKKFFGKDFSATFFPLIGPESKMGPHKFKDKIFVYLKEDLARQFPGQTSEQILVSNREAFNKALVEAHHKAFMDYGEPLIRGILEKPAGEIGSDILDKRIAEEEAPASRENVIKLEREADAAQTALLAAEAEYKKFTDPESGFAQTIANQDIIIKQLKEIKIKDIEKQITALERRRNKYEDQYLGTATPTSGTAKDFEGYKTARAQELTAISKFEELLIGLYATRTALRVEFADAERKKIEAENELTKLNSDPERPDLKEAAEKKVTASKEALDSINDNLKREKDDLEGKTTPEGRKETADRIRDIKRARDANFEGRIQDMLFAKGTASNPAAENKYSLTHLAGDDGEERIRELAFGMEDPKYFHDHADRFREIWNDEAIARAIVWVYKIKDADVLSLSGNDLLKKVLPVINQNPRFKVYDLMRFLIGESVRSAALGNPHLEISRDYIPKSPGSAETTPTIYRTEGEDTTQADEAPTIYRTEGEDTTQADEAPTIYRTEGEDTTQADEAPALDVVEAMAPQATTPELTTDPDAPAVEPAINTTSSIPDAIGATADEDTNTVAPPTTGQQFGKRIGRIINGLNNFNSKGERIVNALGGFNSGVQETITNDPNNPTGGGTI